MKHPKTVVAALVSGSFFLLTAITLPGARSQENNLHEIMERKLDHAHSVLESLIMEDFEGLEESARALEALSEEAGWFVLQTPEYMQRSTGFRLAAAQIEASAREKNLQGAALGYVEMTLKCVQCHQFLRGTRRASAKDLGLGVFDAAVRDYTQR